PMMLEVSYEMSRRAAADLNGEIDYPKNVVEDVLSGEHAANLACLTAQFTLEDCDYPLRQQQFHLYEFQTGSQLLLILPRPRPAKGCCSSPECPRGRQGSGKCRRAA